MAAASSSGASPEPSPLDQFKTGWKGFRSGLAKAAEAAAVAAGGGPEADLEEGRGACGGSAEGGATEGGAAGSSWKSVIQAATRLVSESSYDPLREEGATIMGRPQDSEASEASESAPLRHPSASSSTTAWSKVASRMKAQVADVTEATLNATDKVYRKTATLDLGVDVGGHARDLQRGATSAFKGLADSAKETGGSVAEKGRSAVDKAKDLQGKGLEAANRAKELGAAGAAKAKDRATTAAGAAKSKLHQAGSSVRGLAALSMSPAKLAQFAGVFFAGVFLISMSLSFLPMLPIAPQKFSLLFAFGSMTMLSSFAILKGPQDFLKDMAQRDKLPFSGGYAVGLIGTLVATIVLKSYLLTAFFGVMQAVALLYFVASYVPGGQTMLNMCGSCCKRCTATLCRLTVRAGS